MTLRAIVFDLDDTLYPERGYALSGFDAVAAAFADRLAALPDPARRMRQLFDSPDRGRIFDIVCREASIPNADATVAEMIAVYRTHAPVIAPYRDATAALTRLHGRFRFGLLTDGYLAAQTAKLYALGLRRCLDAVVFTDQWGREFWKPHPRGFEEIARALGVAPAECAYVADNPVKDFIAPRRLGWWTIRVRRADGVYAALDAPVGGEPDRTIPSLDRLDAALQPGG